MNFSAGIQSRKRKRRLAEAEELATDEHGKTRKENQEWIPAFARMTKARCDGSTTATARHSPIYWPANANPILL